MKYLRLSFLLFLVGSWGWVGAQNQTTIALLKKQWTMAEADTSRYRLAYELANYYKPVNTDSTLYFLHQSLQIAERIKDPLRLAQSTYRIGFVYMYILTDEANALEWLNKCVVFAKQAKESLLVAKAYGIMGVIADHQNLPQEEFLLSSLTYAKKANDWQIIATTLNTLVHVYIKKNKWKEAEKSAFEMMTICEKKSDNLWLWACLDYCRILEETGQKKKAYPFLKKAELVGQNLLKKGKINGKIYQLARLEITLKNYQAAEKLLLKGIELEQGKVGLDTEALGQMYQYLPNAFAGQQKYQKAYEALRKYLDFVIENNNKSHRESSELEMTRLQATLENEKKEAEIALLAAQKQQQQLLLMAAAIISLLLIGFVAVLQRNRRRIERQKAELTSLNTTKDKLFAILSHDLRSPVKSLWSNFMLINGGALSQAEFVASVESLNTQLSNVNDMLDNVLNWAVSQLGGMRPKIERTHIAPVIEEQMQLLVPVAQAKGIQLEQQVSPEAQLMVDKNHLAVIVRNLLHNAVKFTHSGGKVNLAYYEKGRMEYIEVKDTGVGMSQERRNKLFELDKDSSGMGTANEPGTGLGLVLVKELADANGGTIAVSSEPGQGTRFVIGFQKETKSLG